MDLGIIGVFIGVGAFVLHLLALALPYWTKIGASNFGLWQICGTVCVSWPIVPDWLGAARAFVMIGFLGGIAVILCMVLYIFISQTKGNTIIGILAKIGCFVCGGLVLLGAIIYAAKGGSAEYLHVGFAFAIIAAIVWFLAGIILFVSRRSQTVTS